MKTGGSICTGESQLCQTPIMRANNNAIKNNGAAAARLHGLESICVPFPGAYAPGFMLTPASQAEEVLFAATCSAIP